MYPINIKTVIVDIVTVRDVSIPKKNPNQSERKNPASLVFKKFAIFVDLRRMMFRSMSMA